MYTYKVYVTPLSLIVSLLDTKKCVTGAGYDIYLKRGQAVCQADGAQLLSLVGFFF